VDYIEICGRWPLTFRFEYVDYFSHLIYLYVKLKPSALPANTAPRLSPLLGAVQAGIAVSFSG
jgi:hypothetical protein